MRVWFNGSPLYRNQLPAALPNRLSALVPLPRPLAEGDVVEAVYCSRPGLYLGAALSLWTQPQLDAVCAGRQPTPATTAPDPFAFSGVTRASCLAPWASPQTSSIQGAQK